MIYAEAGATVEAVLMDAPAGMLPGIEWAVVDPTTGDYAIARSGSGVTNTVTDVYRVSFPAPAIPDTYLVRWYLGAVTLASEELVVSSGPPVIPGGGSGLIAVADLDARRVSYEDATQAQALIDDASAIVRAYVSPVFDDVTRGGVLSTPDVVVMVVVSMVRRALTNPVGLSMEVLGDYTYQAGSNAVATLMPTARERRLLRLAASAFAVSRGMEFSAPGSSSIYLRSDTPGSGGPVWSL